MDTSCVCVCVCEHAVGSGLFIALLLFTLASRQRRKATILISGREAVTNDPGRVDQRRYSVAKKVCGYREIWHTAGKRQCNPRLSRFLAYRETNHTTC